MSRASARRTGNSLPPLLTSMSFLPDGTIDQVVWPERTVIDRSLGLSTTRCFLPAMTQLSPSRLTSTSGAPHSARDRTCVVVGRGGGGLVIDEVRVSGCVVGAPGCCRCDEDADDEGAID